MQRLPCVGSVPMKKWLSSSMVPDEVNDPVAPAVLDHLQAPAHQLDGRELSDIELVIFTRQFQRFTNRLMFKHTLIIALELTVCPRGAVKVCDLHWLRLLAVGLQQGCGVSSSR